jgi:addiction module HigA family antidote
MEISKYRLAKEIHVPAQRIGDIVLGKRIISVDTDLRLCKFFGLSNGYWLHVQAIYDTANISDTLKLELEQIVPFTKEQTA